MRRSFLILAFVSTLAPHRPGPAGQVPLKPRIARVATVPGNLRPTFEVRNLDPEALATFARDPGRLGKAFTVQAIPRDQGTDPVASREVPLLLGLYEVDAPRALIRFRARFAEEPGMSYRVVYQAPVSQAYPLVSLFSTEGPKPQTPTTQVVRVSPSREVVPENLLKLYIEFSAPMSFGEAYEHLKLLDGSGKPLDLPFLELGEELWDPRGMRLTLLFDPGRIKRGLKPREELGPVLEEGKSYIFVLDPGWHDAKGTHLKAGFRKSFRVGPPDMTSPDPASWRIDPPGLGTTEPLAIRFPESLDRAMLGRVLVVTDATGQLVAGKITIGEEETSWSFVPETPWRAGTHALLVDKTLEDLAGNSVDRPFEVDVFKVESKVSGETVRREFKPISRSSR